MAARITEEETNRRLEAIRAQQAADPSVSMHKVAQRTGIPYSAILLLEKAGLVTFTKVKPGSVAASRNFYLKPGESKCP